MEKVLFEEKQSGNRKKLLVVVPIVVISVSSLLGYWIVRLNYNGNPLTIDRFSSLNFIVFGVLVLSMLTIVIVLNSIALLTTKIYRDYIEVRYSPFKRKQKRINSSDIVSYKIRDYNAYREYLGYGIKNSRRRGKAFIISGKSGLQLYLKDGTKVLVGTQKKQAIKYAMEKLMREGKFG